MTKLVRCLYRCLLAPVLLAVVGRLVGQAPSTPILAGDDECVVWASNHANHATLEWYAKGACRPTTRAIQGSRVVTLLSVTAGRVLLVEVIGSGRDASTRLSLWERVGGSEPELQCLESLTVDGFAAAAFGRTGPWGDSELHWVLVDCSGSRLATFAWEGDQGLPPRSKLRLENLDFGLQDRRDVLGVEANEQGFAILLDGGKLGVAVRRQGEGWSVGPQTAHVSHVEPSWFVHCASRAPMDGCLLLSTTSAGHGERAYRLESKLGDFRLQEGTVPTDRVVSIPVPEVFRVMPGLGYRIRGGDLKEEWLRPLLELGQGANTPSLRWRSGLHLDAEQLRGGGSIEARAKFHWSAPDRSRPPVATLLVAVSRSDQQEREYWRGQLLRGWVAHSAPLQVGRSGSAAMRFSLVLPSDREFVGCLLAVQLVVEDERGDFAISPILGACIQPDLHKMVLPDAVVDGASFTEHWKAVARNAKVDEFRAWLLGVYPDGSNMADELHRRLTTRSQPSSKPK